MQQQPFRTMFAALSVVALWPLTICNAQESRPASRPTILLTPAAAVAEYVAASQAGDAERMARTYAPPFDHMGVATARFQRAHRALLAEVKRRFGDAGTVVVDDPRFRHPDAVKLVRHEVRHATESAAAADLNVSLWTAGVPEPHEVSIRLERHDGEWRLAAIGGLPFAKVDGPEKYVLEWDVAEEATRRTLTMVSDGVVKSPQDVVTLRDDLLRTVTKDRMLLRKMGVGIPIPGFEGPPTRPSSLPTSRPH